MSAKNTSKARVIKKISEKLRKQPEAPDDAASLPAPKLSKKRQPIVVKPPPKLKDIAPAVESDSESDDSIEEDETTADVIPLEKTSRKKRRLAVQREQAEKVAAEASPVVYLGHIPYGFFEQQMRGFFSQFGDVKRLRLSRNRKTGKSKHFAFIEFETNDVAQIVAETMDGYLLFDHKLVCHVVPKDKVHPALFKGANKKFVKVPWKKIERLRHNKEKEPQQAEKIAERLVAKETKKRERLSALGIDYDFPGYSALRQTRSKKLKFE